MIKRHFTADSLNEVVNHPSVYEWVRGAATGPLDLTIPVLDEDNVLLMGEYGGVLFIKHSPGTYEAHTQVLPDGRGPWTVDMVNEALRWMFTKTDAIEIVTRVPKGNIAAMALARAINGRPEFTIKMGWIHEGEVIPADIYALRIQDWMAKAPNLEAKGKWFHERLEAEYDRLGYEEPIHPEDPLHDRYVGAAVEMIMGGQPYKAVIFYNRWAGMTGYAPVKVVSTNPTVIDIHESLLMMREDDFWCLRIK